MDITEVSLDSYLLSLELLEIDFEDDKQIKNRNAAILRHEAAVYNSFVERGYCSVQGCDGHEDLLEDFRQVYRLENQGNRYVALPKDRFKNFHAANQPAKILVARAIADSMHMKISHKDIVSIERFPYATEPPIRYWTSVRYWKVELKSGMSICLYSRYLAH